MTADAQGHPRSRVATAWFLGILVVTILTAPVVAWVPLPAPLVALPLVGPLFALVTPLRRSRGHLVVLWAVAVVATVHLALAFAASNGLWPDWLMFDQDDPSRVG